MKKLLLFIAVLLCWCRPAGATVLGDAANALSPGQWVMMSSGTGAGQMGNLNATASSPAWDTAAGAPGPAYDGGQPAWNSNTNQLLIQTTEHGRAGGTSPQCDSDYWICSWPVYPTAAWKPIWTYDAATNNWTIPSALNSGAYPNSSGSPVTGIHVWGSIAWDNTNQVMYVRKHADTTTRIYRYCAPTSPASYCAGQLGTYSAIPQSYTFLADEVHGQAMGWHPTYNGGTLMIFAPSGGGTGCGALAGFKEGTTGSNGTWTTINNPYPSCTFPTSASFLHRAIYSSQISF